MWLSSGGIRRITRHRSHGAAHSVYTEGKKRQDDAEIELTARSVGEPTNGAELLAAMAGTAFVPGGDAPGDVDDDVALTLPSKRPMIFQDSKVELRDRVGVLERVADNAVDHGAPPEFAKMLRDIAFRTHLTTLPSKRPMIFQDMSAVVG